MTTTIEDLVTLNAPEVRTFRGLEFRDAELSESGKWLEGRAVPYDVWQDVGWYMEKIQKGCFAKSIREAARNLPLLLWHDGRSFPIGRSHKWTDANEGLDCVWEIDSADIAQEAARLARTQMLTGLSVGFAPIHGGTDRKFDEDAGISYMLRTEARLLEVSLTPTPAYAGAKVSLVRSRESQLNGIGAGRAARRSVELDAAKEWLERNRTI